MGRALCRALRLHERVLALLAAAALGPLLERDGLGSVSLSVWHGAVPMGGARQEAPGLQGPAGALRPGSLVHERVAWCGCSRRWGKLLSPPLASSAVPALQTGLPWVSLIMRRRLGGGAEACLGPCVSQGVVLGVALPGRGSNIHADNNTDPMAITIVGKRGSGAQRGVVAGAAGVLTLRGLRLRPAWVDALDLPFLCASGAPLQHGAARAASPHACCVAQDLACAATLGAGRTAPTSLCQLLRARRTAPSMPGLCAGELELVLPGHVPAWPTRARVPRSQRGGAGAARALVRTGPAPRGAAGVGCRACDPAAQPAAGAHISTHWQHTVSVGVFLRGTEQLAGDIRAQDWLASWAVCAGATPHGALGAAKTALSVPSSVLQMYC